jgi:hypothetical protein
VIGCVCHVRGRERGKKEKKGAGVMMKGKTRELSLLGMKLPQK